LPGVRQRHMVGADVLGDATRLPGHHVGLPDVVQQRGLAVVHVAHDRHHRRPGHEGALLLHLFGGLAAGGVLLFLHRLVAEPGRDQLDLVEVEALIDGHHQPQLLERELDALGGRHLDQVVGLGDRDELVDPDPGLLPLALLLFPRQLFPVAAVIPAAGLAHRAPVHSRQGLLDVGQHGILIHAGLAALLLLPGATLLRVGAEVPGPVAGDWRPRRRCARAGAARTTGTGTARTRSARSAGTGATRATRAAGAGTGALCARVAGAEDRPGP